MRASVSRTSGPAIVTTPMVWPVRERTGAAMADIDGAKTSVMVLKPRLRAVLMKAISAKLETKNPAVFKFLEKMKWSDNDQNTVTTYKNEDGMTIEAAAQKWVDANEATWKAWLS